MKRSPSASRVGREPLRRAEPIALEAVGHDGQVVALEALANRGELVGRDLHPGGVIERQRRLGEHRGEHRGLEHHREREVAGEAHADRADARTAALLVRQPRERAQPLRHRARLVGGECAELGAHARPLEDGATLLGIRHRAVAAEQRRHVHGEARVPDPAS